jgi:hypothetical protein
MTHPGGYRDDPDDDTRILPQRGRGDTTLTDIQRQVRVPGRSSTDPDATVSYHARRGDETIFVSPAGPQFDPVVGWLVVTSGPGRGQFRPVYYGQNAIGRGTDQRISIDFGDQAISREAHAFIIYDDAQRIFYIRDNGKSNLVRHKGNLVLTPTELHDRDEVTIGETSLLFVALCNPTFDWQATNAPDKV